jgi:hypothetical protein
MCAKTPEKVFAMPRNNKPHLARSLFCAACAALAAAASGCAEDEVGKLFDENGVWSLVEYDLEGTSTYESLPDSRSGGFLMRFNPGLDKVAVASCQDDQNVTDGVPGDVDGTLCGLGGEFKGFYCDCFLYVFEESQMCWKHADAGGGMPEIGSCGQLPDIPGDGGSGTGDGGDGGTGDGGDGTGDGGTDTGGDGGTGTGAGADHGGARTGTGYGETPETLITVSEDLDVGSTYIFQPLPQGIYNSREFSRYKMQQKANNLFDETGCIDACGM